MAHTYTLTVVTEQPMDDATRMGLCDIITDVIQAEGIEVTEAVIVRPAEQ